MNQTGKGTYLWHLNQAARLDLIADRNRRRRFWRQADEAAARAKRHREQAALLDRLVA